MHFISVIRSKLSIIVVQKSNGIGVVASIPKIITLVITTYET